MDSNIHRITEKADSAQSPRAEGQKHPMLESYQKWNDFWGETAVFVVKQSHQNILEVHERLYATTPSMQLSLSIRSLQKTVEMYREQTCRFVRLQKSLGQYSYMKLLA